MRIWKLLLTVYRIRTLNQSHHVLKIPTVFLGCFYYLVQGLKAVDIRLASDTSNPPFLDLHSFHSILCCFSRNIAKLPQDIRLCIRLYGDYRVGKLDLYPSATVQFSQIFQIKVLNIKELRQYNINIRKISYFFPYKY